ncbi:hypothetical protein HNO88_000938 [Novosphingobium chloroacetimidivorans]|uniref:Uncharacterized protein n=1 Tax=Novosphingobium chloroacetimidivorans TaxID=1428314 RepID=A0A7W7K7F8_9SPHN|nr:hypothetical protein [Novosphingobium chloroacetimidivorans]
MAGESHGAINPLLREDEPAAEYAYRWASTPLIKPGPPYNTRLNRNSSSRCSPTMKWMSATFSNP